MTVVTLLAVTILLGHGGSRASAPAVRVLPVDTGTCQGNATLSVIPGSGVVPLRVTFVVSNLTTSPRSLNWSFGDGSFWNTSLPQATSVEHLYTLVGSFVVAITVNSGGIPLDCVASVVVEPAPLILAVSASTDGGTAPLTVTFNGSISGGTGTYLSVLWDFGDGGHGSGIPVSNTYLMPGAFTARVTVVDSVGDSANETFPLQVTGSNPPVPRPNGPGPFGGAIVDLILGAAAVAAIGVVASVFWMRRRTRFPADAPADPPSQTAVGEQLGPGVTDPASTTIGDAEPTLRPALDPSRGPTVRSRPETLELSVPAPLPKAIGGGPAGSRIPDAAVQLSHRVLLHIARFPQVAGAPVGPQELTQQGIGEALGARQNSVSGVLTRLEAAGILTSELRHVRGRSRRVQVYSLTGDGEELLRALRADRTKTGRATDRL